jgi:hypothetical protein
VLENADGVKITHLAGTIDIEEKDRLKKLLFRATRGKALTFFQDIRGLPDRDVVGTKIKDKAVYVVVFQEGAMLRSKI